MIYRATMGGYTGTTLSGYKGGQKTYRHAVGENDGQGVFIVFGNIVATTK